jgi:hypothetical protein
MQLPILSLPAWRVVMQMDQNSPTLPEKFHIHLDSNPTPQLQIELPKADAIATVPAGPGDEEHGLFGSLVNVPPPGRQTSHKDTQLAQKSE